MEKPEIPAGKTNGSRHSVWETLKNMGCDLRRYNFCCSIMFIMFMHKISPEAGGGGGGANGKHPWSPLTSSESRPPPIEPNTRPPASAAVSKMKTKWEVIVNCWEFHRDELSIWHESNMRSHEMVTNDKTSSYIKFWFPKVSLKRVFSPNVRESKTILDSGFHAVDSRFQALNFRYFVSGTGIPDFNRWWDSQAKISRTLETRFLFTKEVCMKAMMEDFLCLHTLRPVGLSCVACIKNNFVLFISFII